MNNITQSVGVGRSEEETNMSLDTTSQPGRPGTDELVPSRYALRVGEIDVLVISDGVFRLPAATLASNADPADLAAWLKDMFLPDAYTWALNVVVVRSGGRTILIDSGVGSEFPSRPGRSLATRLDAAGIDPASVTDVVITHMHVDHVGGLLADRLRGRMRPDVPIHLAAAEIEFWASPDFSRNTFGGFPDVASVGRKAVRRCVPQPVAAVREGIRGGAGGARPSHRRPHPRAQRGPPGVRRRPTDVPRRSVFPHHFDHPDWNNAFDHDPEEAVRVRVPLLRELAATREPFVATHVSFPSVGRVAVAGDVFRWVPAYLGALTALLGQGRTKRRARPRSKRRSMNC